MYSKEGQEWRFQHNSLTLKVLEENFRKSAGSGVIKKSSDFTDFTMKVKTGVLKHIFIFNQHDQTHCLEISLDWAKTASVQTQIAGTGGCGHPRGSSQRPCAWGWPKVTERVRGAWTAAVTTTPAERLQYRFSPAYMDGRFAKGYGGWARNCGWAPILMLARNSCKDLDEVAEEIGQKQ